MDHMAEVWAGTTDTTANMNKFGMEMEGKGIWVCYCTDHVLHLTCKLCYDDTQTGRSVAGTIGAEFALSVKIARDLVSFFGRSPQATEKLKRTQRALDDESIPKVVVKDVETRWWSKAWQR